MSNKTLMAVMYHHRHGTDVGIALVEGVLPDDATIVREVFDHELEPGERVDCCEISLKISVLGSDDRGMDDLISSKKALTLHWSEE